MIRNITVAGWMTHIETSIELGYFTVVIGRTNAGKSAFYSAIQAAATNQTGVDFINWDSNKAVVTFLTDEGNVKWTKSSKVNQYQVDEDEHGWSEPFGKLGGTVPDVVHNILRLPVIQIEKQGKDSKIMPNFNDQFELPFLVFYNGSRVAKVIGMFTGADILFKAIRDAKAAETSLQRKINTAQENIDNYKLEVSKYEWVVTARAQLDNLALKTTKLQADYKSYQKLEQLYGEILPIADSIRELRTSVTDREKISFVLNEKVGNLGRSIRLLGELDKVMFLAGEIRKDKQKLSKMEGERGTIFEVLSRLRKSVDRYASLYDKLLKKNEFDKFVVIEQSNVMKFESLLEKANKKLADFKVLHPNCLLCGRPWDEDNCR